MALLVAPVPLSALTAVQADGAPARVVVRLSAYFEPVLRCGREELSAVLAAQALEEMVSGSMLAIVHARRRTRGGSKWSS